MLVCMAPTTLAVLLALPVSTSDVDNTASALGCEAAEPAKVAAVPAKPAEADALAAADPVRRINVVIEPLATALLKAELASGIDVLSCAATLGAA
jgi:hypothetical protein